MGVKEEIKEQIILMLKERSELLDLIEKNDIEKFGNQYQVWYSKSLKILQMLGKDRINEFIALYESDPKRKSLTAPTYSIQDFVRGIVPFGRNFNHNNSAQGRLCNQFQILGALSSRIDSILEDVEGCLFSDIQDEELKAASELSNINSRAAGALAGVVLERHLQRVAINHSVKLKKKNPTISDINDPLKVEGTYDIPTWRKIQLLGDIRNLCTHKKDKDPSKAQVEELIEGVNSIIKTVF